MISQVSTPGCSPFTASLASGLMTRLVHSMLQKAAHRTRAEVDVTTARRVATYPTAARAAAWTSLVLGVAAAVLIAGYDVTHGAPLEGLFIGAAIISGVAALVAEFTRVRVEWTDTALSFASPWAAPRHIPWDDIVEVKYSQIAGWFIVRGRSGAKIRLSHLLGGLGDLFDEMKQRASDDVRRQIEGATAGVLRATSGT